MNTVNLFKNIEIKPENLGPNLKDIIVLKLKDQKTTVDQGYILHIFPDIEIIDNVVESGYVIFSVKYKALTLNPKIDDIYKSKLILKIDTGLLFKFKKLMIYVPCDKNSLKYKNLEIDDKTDVIIIEKKFQKENWKCIGKLV